MNRFSFRLLLFVCFLLVMGLPVFAQNADLSGTVHDPAGRPVANAEVRVINSATLVERNAKTNESGIYSVQFLPPGEYNVVVQVTGFKTAELNKVILSAEDKRNLDVTLKLGTVSETVNVTAGSTMNTTDGTVSTVVDRQFVENLPLNGRSFQTLLQLTPGVSMTVSGGPNVGGTFSVNGQRSTANSFTVDGVSANFGAQPGSIGVTNTTGNLPAFSILGTTQALVSVDALQEFKVQTSTYAAEYGRQPGGQISMVTRSGTNQYHGSLFEYLRNEAMDANNWFSNRSGLVRPPERQNDFGGTVGGPVRIPALYNGKDRTFFFFSYEGLRLKIPAFSHENVPSLCLRGLGSCQVNDITAAPGLQPILQGFPLPNGAVLLCPAGSTATTCGACPGGAATCAANTPTAGQPNGLADFLLNTAVPSTLDTTSIRIDHTINSKLTIFGRYNTAPSNTNSPIAADLGRTTLAQLQTETLTLGATWALKPNITNEFRVNYSNNPALTSTGATNLYGAVTPPRSSLLIPTYINNPTSSSQFGTNTLAFPGSTGSLPILLIQGTNQATQRQYNVVDSLSYVRGKHQFKFGVDWRRLTPVIASNPYLLTVTFNTPKSLINGIAPTATVGANLPLRPLLINYSLYGEDTWKLTRRLTLTYGLRWDVNPAPTETNGHLPLAVNQVSNLATIAQVPLGAPEWNTQYKNFAPRLGAAYQISQKPGQSMVLRGGFGLFYDIGDDFGGLDFNGRYPDSSSTPITNVAFPLTSSAANIALVTAGAVPVPITNPCKCSINVFDPNLKLPYTREWNVALERELGKDQTLTVSYVGSTARNLLQSTFTTISKVNTNFTNLTITRNAASSDYDALQASFQRRLSHRLQFLTSYTWSHALTNDNGGNGDSAPLRGNAGFDIRHLFSAAVTYDIPAPGKNRLVNAFLGNWSMDTFIHAQTALPVSIAGTVATAPDGTQVSLLGNVVPGVPIYLSGAACTASNAGVPCPGGRRINKAAFTAPTAAQIAALQDGDAGPGEYRGLGMWQIDYAIRREFKVKERLRIELRGEAFNLFNHPNFGAISTSLTAANFGEPTNTFNSQLGGLNAIYQLGGPRSLQVAMKVKF